MKLSGQPPAKRLHQLVRRLGRTESLDKIAEPIGDIAHRLIPPGVMKDLLTGTWLGHSLHPLLTDIPIGSFTSGTLLDLFGGRRSRRAANIVIGVGVLSAVPTAAAGLADLSDKYGPPKRVGTIHAVANLAGVGLYWMSMRSRSHGRGVRAGALGLAGMGLMTVGGYLGGHLVFSDGVGVNNAFWQTPPDEWQNALDVNGVTDHVAVHCEVEDASVLVYSTGERLLASGDRCSHSGGPLHEGEIDANTLRVVCPWHGAVFSLEDGHVVHGPATVPVPSYEIRNAGGQCQVRLHRDRVSEPVEVAVIEAGGRVVGSDRAGTLEIEGPNSA